VINTQILLPCKVEYLQTIVFILIIAALVQLVEMIMQKYSQSLYESLGIYLPLITTNCAVMGVVLLNAGINQFTGRPFTLIESIVNGVMSGVGFMLALVLMAGVREKLELANIPELLEGLPIIFITAGLMALAFLGFAGLKFFS
jgi:electron transport complex protein RnfA